MNTRQVLPITISLALASVACRARSGEPSALSAADVAAIKSTEGKWVQAILAGDWATGAAVHTEAAVRMPPNAPDVRGRAAVQASLTQMGKPSAFTLSSLEIEGRGDLAYAWETFSITFPGEASSRGTTTTGRGLVVLRKQADGSWLASRVIWNSDQPLK